MWSLKRSLKHLANLCYAVRARIRLLSTKKPTLVILTYHRILPANHEHRAYEQPGMVASPENFAKHLQILMKLGAEPVFLDDWLERRANHQELPRLSFAITFDDGWQDNYQYAFPLLQTAKVPATIFLVSTLLDSPEVFWPERVLFILTQCSQAEFSPEVMEDLEWLQSFVSHFPFGKRPATLEEADAAITRLKHLDDARIIERLDSVAKKHPGLRLPAKTRFILNASELDELRRSGLVNFGAHTRHHYRLNRLNNESSLADEIVGCKTELEARLGYPVRLFCYPNGDITARGEGLVEINYLGACTTQTGVNNSTTPSHALRRFTMHDGNSDTSLKLFASLGKGAS
jgi:peptidoglycan/xylan/chitin deacetylase (PgdA/CDA1 family)